MDSSTYGVESINSSAFGSAVLERDEPAASSPLAQPATPPPPAPDVRESDQAGVPSGPPSSHDPPNQSDLTDGGGDSMQTPSLAHSDEPFFPDSTRPSLASFEPARDMSPPPPTSSHPAHHAPALALSHPLPPPPITPSSPSPTLPASSWLTPLSSSLCSLSSLSGPSSPGGPSSGRSPAGGGGGRRAAGGTTGYLSSASEAGEDDEVLDQRSSNGNLVLPTLPSSLASTLKAPLGPGAQHDQPDSKPKRRRLRIAVVGAEEGGRGWLASRLAELLDVARSGGWQTNREGELVGESKDSLVQGGGSHAEELEGLEIALSLHPVAPAAIGDLETRIRLLHSPLLQQLAPLVGGLGLDDLVDLARTGKGRGDDGWIDCVLALVDSDRMEETLSAAAHLSYLAPTLILSLPTLALPPLASSAMHAPPPFLAPLPVAAGQPPLAIGKYPTLSLFELEPLRALFLTPAGRARLADAAGQGFGRHLQSLLVDHQTEQFHPGDEDDGHEGAEEDEMASSMHTSLYSYVPLSTSSPYQSFVLGPKLEGHLGLPAWSPVSAAAAAASADDPFDPLFLPSTVRALAARFGTCSPWARSCLVLGAGLCVWGWLAAVCGATAAAGQGHASKGAWSALAARVGVAVF